MKKFTEDQIRKTVWDMAEKMSKHTAEILLENMENCTKKLGLKDENLEGVYKQHNDSHQHCLSDWVIYNGECFV